MSRYLDMSHYPGLYALSITVFKSDRGQITHAPRYQRFIVSGKIELLDYDNNEDKSWMVYSDCESIQMRSTIFETQEKLDFVTFNYENDHFDTTTFSGTTQIDIILPTNFTVKFHSSRWYTYKGFILHWNCIET